ncbi:MAG: excinuclease ABC subunit UvrC [Candidatus Omnitrophota bacterium]|nr:excinuclease ABC subunit UvrC [Candidatus Omnitrophota bacterium]
MMPNLREIIARAPDTSGVYLMKDKAGRVIYVGKAKSLKKRLLNYLGRNLDTKTVILISNVADIEYRLAPTESLALLLEASLIHKYDPKYNVSLRDDKSFPLVKITNEEFPAICITRKREDDGARYFGPYTSASLLREALKIIRKRFPYRSCKQMPREACLYYRIGLSPAPCVGKINKREYARTIKNISLILEGKTDALMKKLLTEMKLRAKKHDFEEAAKIRDQLNALSAIAENYAGAPNQGDLEDLKNLLQLKKLPERIEAFDISNISGKEATGSMVSFYRGLPDKNNYRRFRIKTVKAIDDYGMLAEVVQRRYLRLMKEKLPLPDLIIIDGGRAHLATAARVLAGLGLNIPLTSIAKEEEYIYLGGTLKPIKLSFDTPALNLIRRIRDEAHRFALAYHHILRRKKLIGR